MPRFRTAVVGLCLCACSSSPSPEDGGLDAASDSPASDAACNLTASATINGTFLGSTLNAQEPLSFEGAQGAAYAASIFVPDYANYCALSGANERRGNSSLLFFYYQGTTPAKTGTVSITSPVGWLVSYATYDAACKTTQQNESPTGGSFTITELDACGIALTFDLTFASGDHVTGSIGAPACAVGSDGGTLTCL